MLIFQGLYKNSTFPRFPQHSLVKKENPFEERIQNKISLENKKGVFLRLL